MPRKSPNLRGFIGQGRLVRQICRLIYGAQALHEVLGSILLSGWTGLGKSRLARAIAEELGVLRAIAEGLGAQDGYHEIRGDWSDDEITAVIRRVRPGDTLFVDEIHRLSRSLQERFYPLIDFGTWRCPSGSDSGSAKRIPECITVPPFTMISATDQPGVLNHALYRRMAHKFALDFYSLRDMRAIIDHVAAEKQIQLSSQAVGKLATVSRGLPATAEGILKELRLWYPDCARAQLTVDQIRRFLANVGIDDRGLRRQDRAMLRHLRDVGQASLESLAGILGHDKAQIVRRIEPYLLRERLIEIKNGRAITDEGRDWLRRTDAMDNEDYDDEHDQGGQTTAAICHTLLLG